MHHAASEDPFIGCITRRVRAPQSKNDKKDVTQNNNKKKKEKTLFDNNIDTKELTRIKEGIYKWCALHGGGGGG